MPAMQCEMCGRKLNGVTGYTSSYVGKRGDKLIHACIPGHDGCIEKNQRDTRRKATRTVVA
jgi:Na+-translocating ferredoxin:NAD+ oxidoreductase RNF subunit RnfB